MNRILSYISALSAVLCLLTAHPCGAVNMKKPVVPGVQRPEVYLQMLEGKRVGLPERIDSVDDVRSFSRLRRKYLRYKE